MNNLPVVTIIHDSDAIGTGFFITENTILTCHHVIKGKRKLQALIYYPHKKVYIDLHRVHTNARYDYAILRIEDKIENWLKMTPKAHVASDDLMQPYIVWCPHESKDRKILRETHNSEMYSEDLYNKSMLFSGDPCPPGTSGSPLMTGMGDVIGLHWASGMGKYKHHCFSVPIEYILRDMKKKSELIIKHYEDEN